MASGVSFARGRNNGRGGELRRGVGRTGGGELCAGRQPWPRARAAAPRVEGRWGQPAAAAQLGEGRQVRAEEDKAACVKKKNKNIKAPNDRWVHI
jgi:hypothetical protein